MTQLRIGYDGRILAGTFRGMARYTQELLLALSTYAPQHRYIVYTDRPLPISLPDEISVRRLSAGRAWASRILPNALSEDKVDIVHFPANTCWFYPFRPTVVTLHDVNPLVSGSFGLRMRLQYYAYLVAMSYGANRIITDSTASGDVIRRYWPLISNRLSPIHLGITKAKETAAAPGSRPSQQPFLLFIGGCDPNKNLLTLVRALAKVDLLNLLVVGSCSDTSYARIVREAITQHNLDNRVHFLGRLADEELFQLYADAFAVVLVSFHEGFGFPILEALQYGTPVITSNTSSMPELAGDAALLVDPADVTALVQAINALQTNPELVASLRTKGLQRSQAFSWEKTAQETLAIYRAAAQ